MRRFFNLSKQILRKTLCISTVAFLVSAMSTAVLPVFAEGEDGSQTTYGEEEIDPFTGEPVSESSTATAEVTVKKNVVYEPKENAFVYYYGDGEAYQLKSNVADGMYTNSAVSIVIGNGLTSKLYRNGHDDSQPISAVTAPGSYVLVTTKGTSSDVYTLNFRIIDEYTNAQGFTAPDGFTIRTVKKDQKKQVVSSNYVSLAEEGNYVISYTCDASNVIYAFQASVDHTPPVLALEAVDEYGIATSEVDLSDLEEGAVMYIDQDGKRISSVSVLKVPGTYTISVQDPAGNTSFYSFVIRMYFTNSLIVVILILAAAIGGLGWYVYHSRKNLRVR